MEDLLPNDGQSFNPTNYPHERIEEDLAEQSKAAQSYPIIDELIKDRKRVLKEADSLSGLGIDSTMPQIQVQIIIEGHKKFQALVQSDIEVLEGLKELYESR